jgi:hypothetical protein
MWGRLDAVPTLVKLLVTPQALLAAAAPPQTEVGLMAALRELVVAVDVHHGDWSGHLEDHVWAPRAERIREEARAALARAAGDTEEDPPVDALREAVTASRQWQIFALHVGAPDGRATADRAVDDPPGSAPGLRPDQAITAARDYGVGIQTLTDPRDEGDQELVHRLASAGRRALRDNLSGDRVPAGVFPWIDRSARLLSWAWLDRSPSFWGPMAALVVVTLAAAVGAPVLLTEQTGAARWWAAGAVPGVLLLGGAALARALGRAAVAVGLLVVGAVLVIGACVSDANPLGVVALVAGALSLVLLALVALVRVRPTGARSRRGPPGG